MAPSSSIKPTFSSPPGTLPHWLQWEDGVRLVGVPTAPQPPIHVQVKADFIDGSNKPASVGTDFTIQVVSMPMPLATDEYVKHSAFLSSRTDSQRRLLSQPDDGPAVGHRASPRHAHRANIVSPPLAFARTRSRHADYHHTARCRCISPGSAHRTPSTTHPPSDPPTFLHIFLSCLQFPRVYSNSLKKWRERVDISDLSNRGTVQ